MFDLTNMKDVRKDYFDSQEKVATKLGVSYYAYCKYEENEAIPSLETVFNFARHYNLSIDYILGVQQQRGKSNYSKYDKQLIANNLKALRISKGLSQRGVALKLKLTQAAIQKYEKTLSNPSLKVIYKYYKYFNFKVNDLCTKDFYNILEIEK